MQTRTIIEIPRDDNPFPREGVSVDEHGVARYADLPPSLLAMLADHVASSPDAEAVVELGGERLTYGQLWNRAARLAGGLRAAGLARGDRVAVRHPAGTNWVVAFWGTLLAGGVVVAVNTRSSPSEVDFVLRDAGVTVDLAPDVPLPDGEPFVVDGVGHNDLAALFYTSGTTGVPKGVPTTHEAFLSSVENMLTALHIAPDTGPALRTLISVPLFHVTGCNAQLLVAARVGGTSVVLPTFDQDALIRAIPEERISYLITVPAVYSLILRRPAFDDIDVSGVRWLGYGGAPIAPALVADLQVAFPTARLFNGYGMTETAAAMSVLPHEDSAAHAHSVGFALPSVDLGVLPLEDSAANSGELVVRGAIVTAGYWHRPETNAETIVDGWLRTGDVVVVDEAGRISIVDRIKDIIIRGGENISSIEVEATLLNAPGVLDAAVLAVPDDVMGEKVGAVLYGDRGLSVDDVVAHCRRQLADFKVPQFVVVTDSPLPRNPGGKLLKAQLRAGIDWGPPLR